MCSGWLDLSVARSTFVPLQRASLGRCSRPAMSRVTVVPSSACVGPVEVEVRLGGRGPALPLVTRPGLGGTVRVLGGAGQLEEAELADLHTRPERDRQVGHVGQ